MSNQKYTIYQRLTKMFGYNGQPIPTNNSFNFSKNELLKTDSKDEYDKNLLQSQQSQYITDKWAKLDQSLYNQSVYYEANRLAAYYDFESMEFSIHGDTNIATPNGFITIKELADKGRDYEFTVYAYDHNQKKVVPAIARNAHFTRNEMTYKITFDDGTFIIATYGHRFLKRNGEFCVVEELKEGDSMMPFYRKSFFNNNNYNWIYSCNSKEGHHGWVSEHNLVAEWFYDKKIGEDEEVHHIDFNGKNNLPENLKIMNINEHRSYHAKIHNKKMWENPLYVQKMKEVAKRTGKHSWDGKRVGINNPSYINMNFNDIIKIAKEERTLVKTASKLNVSLKKIKNELRFNGFKSWDDFLNVYKIKKLVPQIEDRESINFEHIPWDLIIKTARECGTTQSCANKLNITISKLTSSLRMNGFKNWGVFMEAYGMKKSKAGRKKEINVINHKIVSIEPFGVVPVYDLTVPGYKNFATDTIFSHNTPEISAALDIFSEESCQMSEKGEMLTIFSESDRIKTVLEDLFKNKLDINTNLPMWTRGMCKYGDDFVYLKIDPNDGIIGCQQLPNIEIERIEGGSYLTNKSDNMSQSRELRFAWKNRDMEFQNWEIAHFRLLGDDRKLPYGTSILDKIRRIWKQLLLAEDAMLIYRTTRAPERRVFKVFVGNMDDKDIESYVQRVANKFKRDQVVDQKTGQVDMRYNQMAIDQDFFIPVRDISQQNPIETLPGACISLETEIPLLDGRTLKLKEIINEWDNGNKDLWVYSANPLTGELAPGLITWAGVTRKNTDVLKITLDNGEEIISTPDHKFVHRTNGFVEAKDLNIGDSLMPFYRDEEFILKKKYAKKYDRVWDSSKQKWIFTHRMVNNFMKNLGLETYTTFDGEFEKENMKTIHHKDNNRKNNNPTNLTLMESKDHYKYHRFLLWETEEKSKINKEKISKGIKKYIENLSEEQKKERYKKNILSDNAIKITTKNLIEWRKDENNNKKVGSLISKAYTDERKKKHSLNNIENWKNNEFRKKVFSKKQTITFSDEIYNKFLKVFETNLRADKTLKILNDDSEFMSLFISINKDIRSSLTNLNEFTLNHVDKMFKQLGYKNFCEWKKTELKNRGFKNMVAWKYYVDKQNKLYNHKIIDIEYLEEKLDTGTITVDNSEIYHNYHTFAIKSGVFIKNSNLGEIQDIEYLQKKMLAALRVPKAFLGFEDVVGEGKSLALMDIRFARTINKVQKSLVHELNKIALLHLLILGFEDELNNFTLSLTNPSSQSDLLKIEQWKEKITLYKDATSDQSQLGILPVSHTWAKKNILGMSESEVLLDLQQQRLERALGFELSNTQQIIKRTRVFDQVDAKYGISEEDRKKVEATASAEGADSMGLDSTAPSTPSDGGEALSEEVNLFSVIKEKDDLIFDNNKSKDIINELNDKIKDIIK
jgi:hypothetical protein